MVEGIGTDNATQPEGSGRDTRGCLFVPSDMHRRKTRDDEEKKRGREGNGDYWDGMDVQGQWQIGVEMGGTAGGRSDESVKAVRAVLQATWCCHCEDRTGLDGAGLYCTSYYPVVR